MTTLQKTLIATAIAAAVGTGVYEAGQASRLRDQIQEFQQQQAPLTGQLQQLQRERDEATNRSASLAKELARLKNDNTELLKLRAEVTQLRAYARTSAQSKTREAIDPAEAALKSWLDRDKLLRQSFEQWPGKKTPELQLLSEQDWLNATANRRLETDADRREAMSNLRTDAKKKFAGLVNKALERYAEANNQQIPSSLSQLLPFLESPVDSSFLEGYEIAAPGTVHPPKPGPGESEKAQLWAMVEKGGPADKEYDYSIVIYNGSGGWWLYRQSK